MMRPICCSILLTGSTLFAPGAMAACAPQFSQGAQTVDINALQIGTGEVARENFQIRVENADNGACTGTLRISRLTSSPTDPAFAYLLVSAGQTIDVLPTESSAPTTKSDVYVPGIPGGAKGRAVPFNITLLTEWGISSGARTEELLVSLLDENNTVVDTMPLYINTYIPPAVELRIVGATGGNSIAEVNLGTLAPDDTTFSDPFAVRVWSTSPYSVFFESENRGALVHESSASRIPYKMNMDGSPVDITGSTPRSFSFATGALGDLHPLSVVVEPFLAPAGDYSDRVTVTVTAG